MYIPSERNFVSVIDEADSISGLPYSLKNTIEEFRKASYLTESKNKKLPLNGFEYSFDKTTNVSFIYETKNRPHGQIISLFQRSSDLCSNVHDNRLSFKQRKKCRFPYAHA